MSVFKGSSVRYYDATNRKFARIQGPSVPGADYTLQLPPNVGTAGQVLQLPATVTDVNQLEWGDGGGSSQTVATLALQGTDATTTSQAIYGINVIETGTASNLATRLPDPVTGQQTTFVNNSSMSIDVFPAVAGGKINGVVDGYASIPNDGNPYVFNCVDNPLPGAWVWSPPATGQIQLPTISISHTFGAGTAAYGIGVPGAQLINPPGPNWYDDMSVNGFPTLTFTPNQDYWGSVPNLTPLRTLVTTKVYSNFLASDDTSGLGFAPLIGRYVAYNASGSAYANQTASAVNLAVDAQQVPIGPTNTPAEIGDINTYYKIQPANLVQIPPGSTDLIGTDSNGTHYYSFIISLSPALATKTYKFDIFMEYT